MIRIGITAGEESGDLLGASLVEAIKTRLPDIEITGIGGENLIRTGCKSIYPIEKLSVMGITEVFSRYLELLSIRNNLKKYFLNNPPDVFIGVDAPDFNFTLERNLRAAGIKTVHYVSPSIWAWRKYRLNKIAKSIDLMLTLFPFEVNYYKEKGIPAVFVGHPLAKKIDLHTDKKIAREKLGIPEDKCVIAIMPGSRKNELKQHARPFIEAAQLANSRRNNLYFIAGLTNDSMNQLFEPVLKSMAPELPCKIFIKNSLNVMAAADVILLASGTVALEAMLLKKPMVVAYKLNNISYQVAKRMIKIPFVSLPNILANEMVVPECLQSRCEPEILANELLKWLDDENSVKQLEQKFLEIHKSIMPPDDSAHANAIISLINS